MAKRPGMAALAAAAGVSVATIDRLLNGREQVSETTRRAVLDVALRIGHPAAARLADSRNDGPAPVIRFGVLLHKQGQEFYQNMAREMRHAVAQLHGVQGRLELEFAASQSPSEVAAMLRGMAGRCDVIAATAVNHPEISAAVDELRKNGIAVFSLLSDFAQGIRAGYVGLNNLKVGRTAAWMISLSAKGSGKVALFVGGSRWHGHDLRETGFRAYLREERPDLEVLESIVNLETRQLTYETTLGLLNRHSDLRGIFVAGGGMEGAIAALQHARKPAEVALVVNELTAESRAGLAQGWVTLVDATPLPDLCREVLALMVRSVREKGIGGAGQVFLPIQLHVGESL
ncbi:MAG: LacI family transcriptional regulator [Rhodobacteraceae bacterium PARR1]|nr:MAG: LacI family transcriptional regulator [Rhodobacteraceae bacterium PARR1]